MSHHVALKVAKIDIQRALAILELCPDLEFDEQLKLSTLEGETQLYEIVSALLDGNEDDEGQIESLKGQIDTRKERKARFERRIETRKKAIVSLMDSATLTKLMLPEATVSVRGLAPRPKIIDEDAIPAKFKVPVLVTDKDAINAAIDAGETIPGVTITNGGVSLSVRRK